MRLAAAIKPVALGRTRIARNGGRYLPAASRRFKEELQAMVAAQMTVPPLTEPLKLTVHFYKRYKASARGYGDLDNHVKAVLDALNGVVWSDDALIVELHAYKHSGEPCIELEVEKC